MRRFVTWNMVAALLVATAYAPLFHVHTDADGKALLVHAHLLEPDSERSDHDEIESAHSHSSARPIDMLTSTMVHAFHLDAIIHGTYQSLHPIEVRYGFVSGVVARAHAPPGFEAAIPRAPPA